MTLATGSKLGPYEIGAPLGAGGMGEVYRATDTRLGRDVALKFLPEAFARDAQRMARFEREAKVLASRNHRHEGNSLSENPTVDARTPLWLVSGWGCRGRRLSTTRRNPGTRYAPSPHRHPSRTRAPSPSERGCARGK
jgi:serine/threonine protein kinase